MNESAVPRYAFFLYDSRSGSTLLAAWLNRYADISVSHETAFVSRIIEFGHRDVLADGEVDDLVSYLFSEVQFRELGLSRDAVTAVVESTPRPRQKSAIARAIADLYFSERDPRAAIRIIKASPIHYVDLLREWFPNAAFVGIVRDGRAVYDSKRRSVSLTGRLMQQDVVKAALQWRKVCRAIARVDSSVCTIVKYEDFVVNPEREATRILDNLHVPITGRVVTKDQQDYHRSIGTQQRHLHENVARPPEPGKQTVWRAAVSESDLRVYEAIAGAVLTDFGYELTHLHKSQKRTGAKLLDAGLTAYKLGRFIFGRCVNVFRAVIVSRDAPERAKRFIARRTRR